ncbi:hypothetical protein TNCV_2368131 [Trichonephila clavipes]|nr:hypothetical protein TNCV_2368131 [Trichonephila clavipes]
MSYEYGVDEFRRVIQNAKQDLNDLPPQTLKRIDMLSDWPYRLIQLNHGLKSQEVEMLAAVICALSLRLGNVIFQQDNARAYVARRVLIYERVFHRYPGKHVHKISPPPSIENIWYWVFERMGCHRSPATIIDEMWQRFEAAWNDLPVFVIQAQFDSMLITELESYLLPEEAAVY